VLSRQSPPKTQIAESLRTYAVLSGLPVTSDKLKFNIPLVEQAVKRIEGNLPFFEEQFCGLSMCFAEPTTQRQGDIEILAD